MKKNYVIGLDLGINNVGWSIIDSDTKQIEKCGVRLFSISDDASSRRESRNVRRRMKRKDTRVRDVLMLFSQIDFPNSLTIDSKLIEKRYSGIHKKIEKQDIVNILCFVVSHRGYIPFGDEEVNFVDLEGKLPCEYYYDLYIKNGKYRALDCTVKNSDLELEVKKLFQVQKSFYPELEKIEGRILDVFKRKRKFWEGPGSIYSLTPYGRFQTEEQVSDYIRNKEKNPNYEKYLFEDLIGRCSIAIQEKCAPKLNFYAEKFNLLNDFINISIIHPEKLISQEFVYMDSASKNYKFTEKGLNLIFEYCISNTKVVVKNMLKALFGIDITDVEGYRLNKKEEPEFSTMNYYRFICKKWEENNLDDTWLCDIEQYNRVVYHFTVSPGINEAMKMIEFDTMIDYHFSEEEILILKDIHNKLKKEGVFSYHSLSEKVLRRAIQDMMQYQMNFMQVRKKFDYDREAREYFAKNYADNVTDIPQMNSKFIDDIIASPQVKKTLRQAIKIINAIILEKKELPFVISVESAKEMNGKEKQILINQNQRKKDALRKDAKEEISCLFGDEFVTEVNILKTMLYHEINGQCPYCNHPIQLDDVIHNKIEIEHILPRSESFDDSFENKTLSCSNCNHKKLNRTPYQYLFPLGMYESYKKRIQSLKQISDVKLKNFLFEGNLDKYKTRFFHRNLTDTAYATRELVNQIHLFNEFLKLQYDNMKILTLSTPGQLTHKIREQQNLEKDRDDGKYHHAVDASIVAAIATTKLGKILIDSQNNAKFWSQTSNDEIQKAVTYILQFHLADYKNQLVGIDSDEKVNISSQVQKSPQKQLANANMYSAFKREDNYYRIDQIDNIYLLDFSNQSVIKQLDKLFDENDNSMTFLCQDNDKNLFQYLKEIYQSRHGKENPFVSYCKEKYGLESDVTFDYFKYGIRVPSKKESSPVVVRLRYYTKMTTPYFIEKTNINKKENTLLVFDSLSQYCTKVFIDLDKNKFVFLPVYSISVDSKTGELKEKDKFYQTFYDKYVGQKNVKFIANLYNGNYLEIKKKNGVVITGEYSGFHKTLGNLQFKTGEYFTSNDLSFTIYDVDILGNRKKRLTYSVDQCILKM